MANIDRFSIVTLIFFFLSTIFVIRPLKFHVRLPVVGRIQLTLGLMSAPIIAIAILWAAQCIGATQIRDGIVGTAGIKPYNILILFISLAYMAITLDITGVLQAAAFWVSNRGGNNGRRLFLYFYILLTGVSMIIGNDPVILSGTAFLAYYTAAAQLEPLPWLISEFAAANTASMVLFVGNPTNVVICEGFGINNAAFTAYTILPFLACSVTCYLGLAFQFRKPKHVPHKLPVSGDLDPRSVLRDPISAWVGSLLLLTCLVVVIVVSFFHVDVWMVVLPFAVVKFLFDMCWDHFRPKESEAEDAESAEDPMKSAIRRGMSHHESTITDNQTARQDLVISEGKRSISMNADLPSERRENTLSSSMATRVELEEQIPKCSSPVPSQRSSTTTAPQPNNDSQGRKLFPQTRIKFDAIHARLSRHFPTFFTALPRLPFGLIPFAFSQFILIEGLSHRGWIDVFGNWLVIASKREMIPTIWLVGVLGVILCNGAGTNIGATILLTKIVHAANMPPSTNRAAAIALAVASNIGAVSFTFSASLAGLLWDTILKQKKINTITQWKFAYWNSIPLLLMTSAGLAIVTAEMVVLYK
ncbi:hypothetical protein CPB83DRAFT_788128 [Crepidotus variabilis]|uniref:Citrate transporter-like domain-containing protein n=1 Tax=Crepidotus variabilis TaxID=179855 RepID=A0A9P6EKG9_9AGAR|nr:hypothetical protein CPB83DRAFT_788128 [Crepidotus variabilis]